MLWVHFGNAAERFEDIEAGGVAVGLPEHAEVEEGTVELFGRTDVGEGAEGLLELWPATAKRRSIRPTGPERLQTGPTGRKPAAEFWPARATEPHEPSARPPESSTSQQARPKPA